MRLNSIKLSGFKSFSDPTNFMLPGQLVGVVGPNGCGKSNIMDAVRWVLGESKASELRGDSMQDVIFNGTSTRKPASRASVELVFDNEDHRAGGQWAQFAEIAVKRVLTRDGNSSYYINNQLVRRRDVQDVFLGTGLGPRAYAIIGQGTISRIIESKPEELRLFLEEAAGVSKYKERRRETENRLSDTRDNLTRVEDILRELNSNLEKLEKQAEVAQRYQELSRQASLRQHQLWFLKRSDSQREQEQQRVQVREALNALEARMADLRQVEADLEAVRQAHYNSGEEVNRAQGQLYEASAEVGRLEAEIRYVAEGRERVQQRIQALSEQRIGWQTRSQQAQAEIEDLLGREEEGGATSGALQAQLEALGLEFGALEERVKSSQRHAQQQRDNVAKVQQEIGVLAAEQRGLDEQARLLETRRERLLQDKGQQQAPENHRLDALKAETEASSTAAQRAQAEFDALQAELTAVDEQRAQAQTSNNSESARLAELTARSEALKALQERVRTDGKLQPWLIKHGLGDLQALWTRLHITPGWESALEAALRERMASLEVSRLELVRAFEQDAPPTKLAFYTPPTASGSAKAGNLPALADLLRLHDAGQRAVMYGWLQGCYTAKSLDEALALRASLGPGESIFLPSGHSVSANSVTFYAADSEQAGLLARAQEIENLGKQIKAQSLIAQEARTTMARLDSAYSSTTQAVQSKRRQSAEVQARAHELQVQLLKLSQAIEQARERGAKIDADLEEIEQSTQAIEQGREAAQARFEALDLDLGKAQERQVELDDQVIAAEAGLHEWRERQRGLERQAQEAHFSLRSMSARREELVRSKATAEQQIVGVDSDSEAARAELAGLNDAVASEGLQNALALKLEREAQLAARRSAYDDLSAKLRASDERRLQIEHALEPQRSRITELQLKEQAARLGFEQYDQMLSEAQVDIEAIQGSVASDGVRLSTLPAEIERLHRETDALGPVNLAALDELSSARERKQFLDAQSADLSDAMQTLEDAIRKIDAETRELLAGTFATVNEHFGKMFPELFGGGQARLVMMGEEILDSGVQVFAQPPGKKNQSIALLSGGEKALTAIALVFAIFQLNPAPFCLLDEVDAPLDDANTERYARLVTRMSEQTQFLFISHNKIAMEMAVQLIGVTMQEQGVSRIVAVDMDAAMSVAETETSA